MSAAKHTPELSATQLKIARRIADGTYSPMVSHGRTLRAMASKGLVIEHDGWPPSYSLTDAGRAAVAKAEGERVMSAAKPTGRVVLLRRKRIEVNTDPQRRCYNGCHFSSELRWTAWESLDYFDAKHAEARLKFWRELNDYAVSQRGESAKCEFKVEPETGSAS